MVGQQLQQQQPRQQPQQPQQVNIHMGTLDAANSTNAPPVTIVRQNSDSFWFDLVGLGSTPTPTPTPAPTPTPTPTPTPVVKWYWEETKSALSRHQNVKPPHWIAYSDDVCAQLEAAYVNYPAHGSPESKVMLRISQNYGSPNYIVDVTAFSQLNAKTNFSRKVLRDGPPPQPQAQSQASASGAYDVPFVPAFWPAAGGASPQTQAKPSGAGARPLPSDLADEDQLVLYRGSLVQVQPHTFLICKIGHLTLPHADIAEA